MSYYLQKLDIQPADRLTRYKVLTKLFELDEDAKGLVDYSGSPIRHSKEVISPQTLKELSNLFPSLTITIEAQGEDFGDRTKTYYYRGQSQAVDYTFPEPNEARWN